jgi:hypothetical protein
MAAIQVEHCFEVFVFVHQFLFTGRVSVDSK